MRPNIHHMLFVYVYNIQTCFHCHLFTAKKTKRAARICKLRPQQQWLGVALRVSGQKCSSVTSSTSYDISHLALGEPSEKDSLTFQHVIHNSLSCENIKWLLRKIEHRVTYVLPFHAITFNNRGKYCMYNNPKLSNQNVCEDKKTITS